MQSTLDRAAEYFKVSIIQLLVASYSSNMINY